MAFLQQTQGLFDSTSDVTVAISGVGGASAVGSLLVSAALALTGVQSTGSVDSVVYARSAALTSVSATTAVDSVTTSRTVATTTTLGTGAAGSVAENNTVGIAGNSSTGSIGSVTAARSTALTTVNGTGAVGTLASSRSTAFSGVAGTSAVGSTSDSTTVSLSSVLATGTAGSVIIENNDVIVSINGVSGVGFVGMFGTARSMAASGVAASTDIEPIGFGKDFGITGVEITGAANGLTSSSAVTLFGLGATTAVGTIIYSEPVFVAISGVGATTSLGDIGSLRSLQHALLPDCHPNLIVGDQTNRVVVQGASNQSIVLSRPSSVTTLVGTNTQLVRPSSLQVGNTRADTQVVNITSTGLQGEQGEPGPAGVDVGAAPFVSLQNAHATTMYAGAPAVRLSGVLRLATNAVPYNECIGLVMDTTIIINDTGRVQTSGKLVLTQAQWDIVTGMVGGLSPEQPYFVNAAGFLTPTPDITDGKYLVPVGYAVSSTEFIITIGTQVQL